MQAMKIIDGNAVLTEIPMPTPSKGEVRIKVVASAVNPAEEKVIGGEFAGRFLHARNSPLVVGWDFAGTVDLAGDDVPDLAPGTPVWGHLPYSGSSKQGANSEYITIAQDQLAIKPDDVPFHIAAAAATIAMTAAANAVPMMIGTTSYDTDDAATDVVWAQGGVFAGNFANLRSACVDVPPTRNSSVGVGNPGAGGASTTCRD